jgi:hypothetical protein
MTLLMATSSNGPESFSYVMVVFGFTAVGIALLTAMVGWMRRQAANAMDDETPQLDTDDSTYASRMKFYFIKSAKTNVLYYFALGELVLGIALLLIGLIANVAK